jgi:diguanylate cyclase (GGDEF)-like protein/PAS domain S-box-containing protein
VHLVLRLIRPDPRCTMISLEDVSATVEQERLLYQHRQWLGLILEQIEGYCVAMLNTEGCLLAPNPSIERMFGANSAQLVDQCLLGALGPAQSGVDLISFSSIKRTLRERSSTRLEIALRHRSGKIIWGDVLVARTLGQDQAISGYVMFIRDASIQHAAQQALVKDAQTDPLTGLFNRRGLESNMHGQPDRPKGSACVASWIMMDIDHFKDINDSHGHAAGDDVLRQVASVLKNSAREGDIVARVGGEEFLIMLPGASLATALAASERLRRQIENSEMVSGLHRLRVTASFGVAEQAGSERWVETVAMADEALLIAKTSGRNRCVTAGNSS